MSGTVDLRYTVGAGNNIFQYIYARLVANAQQANLSTSWLDVLKVEAEYYDYDRGLPLVKIGQDIDLHQYLSPREPANYQIRTYPEDYTLFKPHMDEIREWFEDIETSHPNDLVFHLRLGDRLLLANEYEACMKTEPEAYIEAIKMFEYDNLHIVTDMPSWTNLTCAKLDAMRFHTKPPMNQRIDLNIAIKYHNELIEKLSELNPIVHCGNPIKDDFDFMRSFGQILFKHSTLAWWAAALSHANKVGVYGPWRPIKGAKNKNLGQTDFDGWFQWGLSNG